MRLVCTDHPFSQGGEVGIKEQLIRGFEELERMDPSEARSFLAEAVDIILASGKINDVEEKLLTAIRDSGTLNLDGRQQRSTGTE